MSPDKLRELLSAVSLGSTSIETALESLKSLPFDDLGYARVDQHRALRQGVPEVVFGEGKTAAQIAGVSRSLIDAGQSVLITRLSQDKADELITLAPELRYNATARTASHRRQEAVLRNDVPVLVITAGTSDVPVAEEALETLALCDVKARGLYDVGVAGLHRILSQLDDLRQAPAVIVCAGMEGALASVVGGLVASPVIAVPTSVGYGASAGGFAALLGMLSSCAAGVTVVNVDNGFGAAMALVRVLASSQSSAQKAPEE